MSTLDLIHEGNLGLIEAARRFDPSRNVKFISLCGVVGAGGDDACDRRSHSVHPMPPSVLATPSADHVVPAPHVDADEAIDGCLADVLDDFDEAADLDETFHDIQLRASGFPRSADRLRRHLN